MNDCLNQIKAFYDKGYKCIKYEYNTDEKLAIYLKNFDSEKIQTLYCDDRKEIKELKEYIDFN